MNLNGYFERRSHLAQCGKKFGPCAEDLTRIETKETEMLAQSFMTAAELNITEPQKQALIKTLVLMETGKLIHVRNFDSAGDEGSEFTGHFNMVEWCSPAECGTVCCIAGTAELVGDVSFAGCWYNDELSELFGPNAEGARVWSKITVPQAAAALRSFLTTGAANWAASMKVS